MDELFPALIVLISVVAGIASTAKKEKAQKAAEEHRAASAQARMQTAEKLMKQQANRSAATAPTSFSNAPGQVMTPTVHTHLQPDCETHDQPGSLGYASQEGKDPCHQSQLTHKRPAIDTEVSQEGGLTFDWSGDSMVKAVVMQEVLNRPIRRTR